jgi:hypothetical protein
MRSHLKLLQAYCEIPYEKRWTKGTDRCSGPLGIIHDPNEKENVTANCSENQFISHDLCDENHEQWMETRVQILLAYVDKTP